MKLGDWVYIQGRLGVVVDQAVTEKEDYVYIQVRPNRFDHEVYIRASRDMVITEDDAVRVFLAHPTTRKLMDGMVSECMA